MDDRLFVLTSHVCRLCAGRILEADNGEFVCADCAATGKRHDDLCACGIDLPALGRVFECVPNPKKTADMPSEIVFRERPAVQKAEARILKPRPDVMDTSYAMIS